MRILLLAIVLALAGTIQAQQKPTEPRTKLETFQASTGVVLIKNFSEIGNVAELGNVTVTSYEFVDAQTHKKEYGIGIEAKGSGPAYPESRAYVDYDEIDSLLAGIDYIVKVNKDQSKLKNFEAHYKTKGDLDVATFSSGDHVEAVVSVARIGTVSVYLSLDKLQKFRQLIVDAKAALDAAK
jgi:hypothetical protein